MSTVASETRKRNQLERFLSTWDMRLRLVQSVIWLPRGLAAGLLLAILILIAARIWPLLPTRILIPLSAVLALLGVIGAMLGVWLWKRTPLQRARRFDRVFGLKERMSAAIEISDGSIPAESDAIAGRQLDQALRVAGQVRSSELLPFRADWREWTAPLAALALVITALVLPNPQDLVIAQQDVVDEAIDRQAEELKDLREQVLEDDALSPEEQQAIVEALDEAIETLEQPGVTQEEAVAALQAAQEELRDLSSEAAAEQQAALEEASGLLDGTAAQEAAEALAQGDAAAAAEALDNLDLDNLSAEEQQELAESLEQAAETLEGTNPDAAAAMREAAEALQSGDTAAAEEALGEAAESIEEAGSDGQTAQQVDEYADAVGEGQAGVAQAGRKGQQGQGNQPGQNGMGQAPGQGQGQGQGEGQQQGQGGSGAGRGEGNGETRGGQAGQMGTDNGPGDGGETSFPDIYDPQRIGGEGGPEVDVPGNPGAGVPTGAEGEFADNPDGESSVAYDEVYEDYEEAVNEALDTGYVPLGLRDLIRKYFSQLDPASNAD